MRLLLLLTFAIPAFAATDWLCTEEASQRKGNAIYACGIGDGRDENEARSKAFLNAKAEFARICDASDDCRGHRVSAEPARTACEGLRCYRLVVFTIGQSATYADKTEAFTPFVYDKESNLPRIRVGMAKADVLRQFGAPDRAETSMGSLEFDYSGRMCQEGISCFAVFDQDNRVLRFNGFKPLYTGNLGD